jgi:rRNA-processing protein FCF1
MKGFLPQKFLVTLKQMRASVNVIPDTNILINNLGIVKSLIEDNFPMKVTVSISKTILRELDFNKKTDIGARKAIRYIESVIDHKKLAIDEYRTYGKMDVVYCGDDEGSIDLRELERGNNDDKILKYVIEHESGILLTDDRSFHLKASSLNVYSILLGKMSYKELRNKIIKRFGNMEEMEIYESTEDHGKTFLLDKVKGHILPVVCIIMERRLGEAYKMYFPIERGGDVDLSFLLKLVVKHFHLFDEYIPKASLRKLKEAINNIDRMDGEELKKELKCILVTFRLASVTI